ncbi:hypothetical protein JHK87_016171 [Glycine soja]|nr:hypothetical protein JHK87_016171 [Glycine soja]
MRHEMMSLTCITTPYSLILDKLIFRTLVLIHGLHLMLCQCHCMTVGVSCLAAKCRTNVISVREKERVKKMNNPLEMYLMYLNSRIEDNSFIRAILSISSSNLQ